MVSPVHGDCHRCQAEIPLIVLFRFPEPALPDKAWHDEVGCTCGAGMPCECNQEGDDGDLPDVTEIIFEELTIH
jgi:hypothetical protein